MRSRGYILIALCIALAAFVVFRITYADRNNDNRTGPYFSAAANLRLGGQFMVDAEDVNTFKDTTIEAQYAYKFRESDNLTYYNHNPIGFAYIVRFATTLFPFAGDNYALILLQVLMHVLLCLLMIGTMQNRTFTILFTILYALNPLILNIVVLNYYYFWQCIPGFLLMYLMATGKPDLRIIGALLIVLVFATLARPTIIFLSAFCLAYVFKRAPGTFALVSSAACILFFIWLHEPSKKNIWHTVYVGIAAYPNEHVGIMSDDEAYQLYLEKTGDTLNASFGGNYYTEPVIAKYTEITHNEVTEIAREEPFMFIRNALLNSLQIFSIGYINLGIFSINLGSAIIGALFLIALLISGQFALVTGICLSAITFCLYYPPIQAYHFGAYVISIFGFFHILNYFFPGRIKYTAQGTPENREKKRILYICSNDGSDMRINKELRSLSTMYEITFVGVGTGNGDSYARQHCKYFHLIIGRRNTTSTMIRQIYRVMQLKPGTFNSIHIINEQLMVFFYPFLIGRHVVLDIFDSIFLMWNKSRNRWKALKKLVYAPVDVILVTDRNRQELMPDFTQNKILVLENFPYRFTFPVRKKTNNDRLTIIYSGWLGQHRGTEVLEKLLAADPDLHVIMAGWFADDASRQLAQHPRVDYRGIMAQEESLTIAAEEGDYILCVYAPNNENNINASPNKIYDAIQTATPVIINREIRIAAFVEQQAIGITFGDYYHFDEHALIKELKAKRNTFNFSEDLQNTYTWDNIEHILLEAHHP